MKPLVLNILPIVFLACSTINEKNHTDNTIIRIETSFGNIDIKLYDETPLHRDNFIKLIKEGFYKDLLFHRVINDFMIQGGDPDSKNAHANKQIGSGGPGYTIPAEFNTKFFHKKGALAAARLGDNVNPEKESSGSQFYIVQGSIFSNDQIDDFEFKMINQHKQLLSSQLFRDFEKEYFDKNMEPDYEEITAKINKMVTEHFNNSNSFKFTNLRREYYTTTGGTPHLDGSYTVFGETIDGFEVIDKIASSQTNNNSRPLNDIKMNIRLLNE